jgi:class 3 adenylate cyclase/FixJ family two-component response regulator
MSERLARILAVDDKPENIRLLEAILVPSGYEVITASSGDEALAKVRDTKPDMVLTDIVMPGMTGYELCRRLRADPATAFLPIVTVTASGAEEKREALDAGADDFVAKPFDKTELLARVRSLLRVKRYYDDLATALDRQVAIGEVLRTISSSAFHLEPVLEAVAKHAARLCDARDVIIWRTVGDAYLLAVAPDMNTEVITQMVGGRRIPIGSDTLVGRAHLEKRPIQVPDLVEYYRGATSRAADLARLGGTKTLLNVPLIRDETVLGVISLARLEVRPFTDEQIELVRTFADQAAIAIANVELFATVERQRHELSRFLSPQISALITSEQGAKMLEGHRRQITVVFLDLRGFTAFAETAEPEEVLGVLREYQKAMGELIVAHQGTLEHFAGDGMMVWFNDPLPVERHELQAVRMACAMRERFDELAKAWEKKGYDLGFGVGIATGYATLGRIGFEGRYDYGAIGNVVILAQRLSAEAKAGQILLSQRVQAAVEADAETTPVGELTLKGFTRPVPAFDARSVKTPAPAG